MGGAAVRRFVWVVGAVFALTACSEACAESCVLPRPFELDRLNRQLAGHVVDYTHNHGRNNALWSQALGERRDLYVYLPPGFDPCKQYPLIIYLHAWAQDEHSFVTTAVRPLDDAIRTGRLPPAIIAAPDGSLDGVEGRLSAGSFFLNTPVGGRFEDYLMQDVWDFLMANYPIRPERDAHLIAGVSMGGGAAFHTAIKYPDRFGSVLAFIPPLNPRWEDCHGRYMANFDPNCWTWRTDFDRGHMVVGRFYGFITIRQRRVVFPIYGRNNPDTAALVSQENPIEMLDAYDVHDGDFAMYIAYAGRDQFNCDAQVESFLYRACQRGIHVEVDYDPFGHHDTATVLRMAPRAFDWMAQRLAAYAPHD
jgi:S-formylglutathione hydrolase FrmB